eukprot:CAMPEP_0172482058 /NCGR_PEP_ID=MMETSP1066-20121228/8338_1 /TAXON_ID=671091 /ORGANISM="Coscinodiscus wailesii, Strain CCMP2513" /LENGTH=506 /DNA_ID=CAMNT_0013244929 /DNA_START=213 /DNA_END=1733 /DNA_ORIENTATION=+
MFLFHRLATILLLSLASPITFAQGTSTTQQQQQQNNRRPQSAGKIRSNADLAMSEGRFDDAIQYCKQAIELEPQNALNYYKRYRVYNRMNKLESALSDLTKALEYESTKMAYRHQRAKLLVSLGQCNQAVEDYALLMSDSGKGQDASIVDEARKATDCAADINRATVAFTRGNYRLSYDVLTRVLSQTERADDLLFMKAESAFHIGEYYSAVSDTARILKNHGSHLDAYRLRGDAYYRLGENDMAINHYREALKSDPEHKGCKAGHKKVKALVKKVKKAEEAMSAGNYEEALSKWQQAIVLDDSLTVFNHPTLLKISECYSKLGKHNDAIATVRKYMAVSGDTIQGNVALGDALMESEQYEEAVRTYRQAFEDAPEGEDKHIREKLQKAETALKQSKQKNYYKILNVSRQATSKEIKKSYRELALKWHPDKNTGDSKEEAEKMFQDISEAYEVLSSDELRGKYDRGEDVFENQGGGGGHRDAHQFFRQHFNNGGGGGGGQRFSFHF